MFGHIYATFRHKLWVARFMFGFACRLSFRALLHDNSKLSCLEAAVYAQAASRAKGFAYGSEQYTDNLGKLGPALEHHYSHNSHHPEHYQRGILDMNLLDLVEMFCDWQAAAQGELGGNVLKSIEINQKRFDLDEVLSQILKNSIFPPR